MEEMEFLLRSVLTFLILDTAGIFTILIILLRDNWDDRK